MKRIRITGLCLVAALAMCLAATASSASAIGVTAWGGNFYGQLGNGSSTGPDTCMFGEPCSTTPVAVSGLMSGVSTVSAGGGHSLTLLKNGTGMAWGDNCYGQLGNGTSSGPEKCGEFSCSTTPVAVSGLSGVTAVSAGGIHSLALLSHGTVRAWGNNGDGELGNGTTTGSNVPVTVSGPSGATNVSGGGRPSMAPLGGGTALASGYDGNGARRTR